MVAELFFSFFGQKKNEKKLKNDEIPNGSKIFFFIFPFFQDFKGLPGKKNWSH